MQSSTSSLKAYGVANIFRIHSSVLILVACQVITAGNGSSSDFSYGIDRNLFKNTCGFNITPHKGGIGLFMDSNGNLNSMNGRAGTFDVTSIYWTPARLYDNTNIGSWPQADGGVLNSRIFGLLRGFVA